MEDNNTMNNGNTGNQLSEKQSFFKDGIQYSIKMAELSYHRLQKILHEISKSGTTKNKQNMTTAAITDAWSIIDSIHRLRRLLEDAPRIKQNSQELQLFYRRTNKVKDFRDGIQHLDTDKYYIENKLPIWGVLNWVFTPKKNSNSIYIFSFTPGHLFQRETPFINPAGKTIREPIDLITLEANKTVCLSELIDNLNDLIIWLDNTYLNLKNPLQSMLATAEFEFEF